MSRGEACDGHEGGAASDEERYRALQSGYREALLVQLDLVITELEEQGDFTREEIETAVKTRLREGRGALRSHKLAEDWKRPPC